MRTVVRREGAGAVRTFHRCGDTARAPVNAFKSENDLPELITNTAAFRCLRGGGERKALPLNATRTVETSQWRCISAIEFVVIKSHGGSDAEGFADAINLG